MENDRVELWFYKTWSLMENCSIFYSPYTWNHTILVQQKKHLIVHKFIQVCLTVCLTGYNNTVIVANTASGGLTDHLCTIMNSESNKYTSKLTTELSIGPETIWFCSFWGCLMSKVDCRKKMINLNGK